MRNIRFVKFSCLVLWLCMEMGRFLEGVGYEFPDMIGKLRDREREPYAGRRGNLMFTVWRKCC
jgi:hypothetical protein